jgi:hypothetical protein
MSPIVQVFNYIYLLLGWDDPLFITVCADNLIANPELCDTFRQLNSPYKYIIKSPRGKAQFVKQLSRGVHSKSNNAAKYFPLLFSAPIPEWGNGRS